MSRIQKKNRATILEAALDVFSSYGFRGATVDQIATAAGMSKPNLLYYFPSKDAIHETLLSQLLETWLNPLKEMDPDGDPFEEIMTYVRLKIEMARDYPRESRLFANEILQGAPRIHSSLTGDLKTLVDAKTKVISDWMQQGKITKVDPYHLLFSIWALTQHYADFDVQIRAVLGPKDKDPFPDAEKYLNTLFTQFLKPA